MENQALISDKQADAVHCNAGTIPREAQLFLRGGFDADLKITNSANLCNIELHLRKISHQHWVLTENGGI